MGHLILLPFLFSFVYPLQPAPPNPYPSIHLPRIHLYKEIGCKYFGVECQCISSPPAPRQPQSNQPCLFVQLKLFVPCFPWHATPSSLIKSHTFSFPHHPSPFPPPPPSVCVSWKIDKPCGAVLCACVCVCAYASRVCESCQSCQHDWSCSGRQPSVEQQPFTPYNKHTLMHTHKTSVLHTTELLCDHDATTFLTDQRLIRRVYSCFLEHAVGAAAAAAPRRTC